MGNIPNQFNYHSFNSKVSDFINNYNPVVKFTYSFSDDSYELLDYVPSPPDYTYTGFDFYQSSFIPPEFNGDDCYVVVYYTDVLGTIEYSDLTNIILPIMTLYKNL